MIVNKRKIWNLHAHSQFSAQDALPEVKDMVATVKSYGQPALGLTDHGNMAGSVQLYKNCSEVGIKPFPGTELYVVHNRDDKKDGKKSYKKFDNRDDKKDGKKSYNRSGTDEKLDGKKNYKKAGNKFDSKKGPKTFSKKSLKSSFKKKY